MTRRILRNCALALVTIPLLLAATCPPAPSPVVVHFEQIGACNGYQQTVGPGGSGPHNTISAGANGAFVAFRIISIDNSKQSTPFQFDPDKLFVTGSPSDRVSTTLSLAHDHGWLKAVAVTVPAGANQNNNGIAVARVSTAAANGSSEANNTNYFLQYDRGPSDPGVFLQKKDPNRTSWPQTDNCLAISF